MSSAGGSRVADRYDVEDSWLVAEGLPVVTGIAAGGVSAVYLSLCGARHDGAVTAVGALSTTQRRRSRLRTDDPREHLRGRAENQKGRGEPPAVQETMLTRGSNGSGGIHRSGGSFVRIASGFAAVLAVDDDMNLETGDEDSIDSRAQLVDEKGRGTSEDRRARRTKAQAAAATAAAKRAASLSAALLEDEDQANSASRAGRKALFASRNDSVGDLRAHAFGAGLGDEHENARVQGRDEEEEPVNIAVVSRCRPLLVREMRRGVRAAVSCDGNEIVVSGELLPNKRPRRFGFDRVFGPRTSQARLYAEAVYPVVRKMLDGFNCSVLAYGQTGSGKTFTMEGGLVDPSSPGQDATALAAATADPEDGGDDAAAYEIEKIGVIPRAVHTIFREGGHGGTRRYWVYVSHMEIYNERLFDLLAPSKTSEVAANDSAAVSSPPRSPSHRSRRSPSHRSPRIATGGGSHSPHRITKSPRAEGSKSSTRKLSPRHGQRNLSPRQARGGGGGSGGDGGVGVGLTIEEDRNLGVIVKGLTQVEVKSPDDIFAIIARSKSNRRTAETMCNIESSRSHGVFCVRVISAEPTPWGGEVTRDGRLSLVDLSGSENIKRSGAVGARAKEAAAIGQSLLALGRVIKALVKHAPHIPYRESKLTRVLGDSLGGNAFTAIILNITPNSGMLDETLNTLTYAKTAQSVQNTPKQRIVNKSPTDEATAGGGGAENGTTSLDAPSLSCNIAKELKRWRDKARSRVLSSGSSRSAHIRPWEGRVPIHAPPQQDSLRPTSGSHNDATGGKALLPLPQQQNAKEAGRRECKRLRRPATAGATRSMAPAAGGSTGTKEALRTTTTTTTTTRRGGGGEAALATTVLAHAGLLSSTSENGLILTRPHDRRRDERVMTWRVFDSTAAEWVHTAVLEHGARRMPATTKGARCALAEGTSPAAAVEVASAAGQGEDDGVADLTTAAKIAIDEVFDRYDCSSKAARGFLLAGEIAALLEIWTRPDAEPPPPRLLSKSKSARQKATQVSAATDTYRARSAAGGGGRVPLEVPEARENGGPFDKRVLTRPAFAEFCRRAAARDAIFIRHFFTRSGYDYRLELTVPPIVATMDFGSSASRRIGSAVWSGGKDPAKSSGRGSKSGSRGQACSRSGGSLVGGGGKSGGKAVETAISPAVASLQDRGPFAHRNDQVLCSTSGGLVNPAELWLWTEDVGKKDKRARKQQLTIIEPALKAVWIWRRHEFMSNSAGGNGGALCSGFSIVSWDGDGAEFISNTAGARGGAMYYENYVHGDLSWDGDGTKFIFNTAGLNGGAIHAQEMFAGENGGALAVEYLVDDGSLSLGGATFINNRAGSEGGAMYLFNCVVGLNLTDLTFQSNSATGEGGAVAALAVGKEGSPVTFVNCAFVNNKADGTGGADEFLGGQLSFISCEFEGNSAGLRARRRGSAQQKWCSYHNTKSHSDAECQKQRELRENKQKELKGLAANLALLQAAGQANLGQANFANLGSAHLAHSSPAVAQQGPPPAVAQPGPPEPTSFGFSFSALGTSLAEVASSSSPSQPPSAATTTTPAAPAPASSQSSTPDHHLPSGFFGAFMATPAEFSSVPFRSDGSYIRMVVDSGATDNYLDPALTPGVRAIMHDVEDLRVPHTIVAAGQHLLQGVTSGTIFGAVTDADGNDQEVSFNVVLVPGLGTNLFSVTAAMMKGVATLFHPDNPRLESGDIVIPMQTHGVNDVTGKLMCSIKVRLRVNAGGQVVHGNAPDGLALKAESADLWHRRMGHINRTSLDVLRKEPDNGVDYTGDVTDCSACPLGKSTQQPHPKKADYGVLRPFQHVTVDTLGPFTPPALGGYKYAMKFVDQFTKWKEIVLMPDKKSSVDAIELFNKGTVIPTGERIHVLRADHGTEFKNEEVHQYCLDVGIQLQFTAPYTPQQIGANERAGRTVLNSVRCMLADSTLPRFLWGELMQTAVYLSNRTPHAALQNGTPYKALYGKDAQLGHLRVIGSRAFVHEETYTRKLKHRAWEGRLVGYSMNSKSYRVYNAETHRVRESRNVVIIEPNAQPPSLDARGFDDGEFTYDDHDEMIRDVRNHTVNHSVDSLSPDYAVGDPSVLELLDQISNVTARDLGLSPAASSPGDNEPVASGGAPGGVSPPGPGPDTGEPPPGASPGAETSPGSTPPGLAPSGAAPRGGPARGRSSSRSGRGTRGGPSRGGSARGGIATRGGRGSVSGRGSRGGRSSTSASPVTRAASRIPNAKTISELRRLSYAYTTKGEFPDVAHRDGSFGFVEYAYTTGIPQPGVPRNIQEARAMPDGAEWNAAAEREMASLKERGVFELVPRTDIPPGRKCIKTKWVFRRKADGTYKGRVVAQGWNQVPGIDSGSTYAPVCKIGSVRTVGCLVVRHDLFWDHLDVSTAFLYADIQELVFVEQPPGFEVTDEEGRKLVNKVNKSLYGLAQSPGNWFRTIDPVLVEIGFVPLKSDPCVYLYDHNGVQIYLTLYVDDLLLAGNDPDTMSMVKEKLKKRFKMKDMGAVSLVLGMEIKRDREKGTLTISQEAYSKSVLERFGMSECKPTNTPGYGPEISNKQPEDTLLDEEETKRYQGIVGCLMYLTQVLSSRTKHIALRFFFIRELVSEGRISIHYIPTDMNPADIGTKHLNKHRFRDLLDIINNFDVDDFISRPFKETCT
eukprot:g14080.t1